MHDFTEVLSIDDVVTMGHGAELAVVLPHLLPGQLGLAHDHLHVTVTQGGHHHHGAGLAPHTVKVHRLTVSHSVDLLLVISLSH